MVYHHDKVQLTMKGVCANLAFGLLPLFIGLDSAVGGSIFLSNVGLVVFRKMRLLSEAFTA